MLSTDEEIAKMAPEIEGTDDAERLEERDDTMFRILERSGSDADIKEFLRWYRDTCAVDNWSRVGLRHIVQDLKQLLGPTHGIDMTWEPIVEKMQAAERLGAAKERGAFTDDDLAALEYVVNLVHHVS